MAINKKDADGIVRSAIKLGVREDHAKAIYHGKTTDESHEAFKGFVEALEQVEDEHFSRK